MDKTVECLETFEPFTLLLCGVYFGDAHVVIYKSKDVPFCSQSNSSDWAHEICVYKLI